MASVQSNYAAWPASIPASHAGLRWRPRIQPASGIRVALFILEADTNLGLFTSACALQPALRAAAAAFIQAFEQGASLGPF